MNIKIDKKIINCNVPDIDNICTLHMIPTDSHKHEHENDYDACVIWLHGFGSNAYDLVSLADMLSTSEDLKIKHIFPEAPLRPITIVKSQLLQAWFDIYEEFPNNKTVDELGLLQSQKIIEAVIIDEINQKKIPSQKIILAGFSQGGGMAIHCGLNFYEQLAGIISISGLVVMGNKIAYKRNEHSKNKSTKIRMYHGIHDPIVPYQKALSDHEFLLVNGYDAKLHNYPVEHSTCQDEIHDIGQCINEMIRDD